MKLLDIIKRSRSFGPYFVNEGLIKSTSMPETYVLLTKKGFDVAANKDPDSQEFVSSLHVGIYKPQQLKQLSSLLTPLGWYISVIMDEQGETVAGTLSSITSVVNQPVSQILIIVIEPKYDAEIDWDSMKKKGTKMYHATPKPFWQKIQRIGLVPKTQDKISWHPDRVYLTRDPRAAVMIATQLSKFSKYSEYVVLEIDLSKLSYQPKLYSDPNFSGLGVYMLTNIPPKALQVYKEVSA